MTRLPFQAPSGGMQMRYFEPLVCVPSGSHAARAGAAARSPRSVNETRARGDRRLIEHLLVERLGSRSSCSTIAARPFHVLSPVPERQQARRLNVAAVDRVVDAGDNVAAGILDYQRERIAASSRLTFIRCHSFEG